MILVLTAFLLLVQIAPPKASLDGVVLRDGSNDPLAGAQIGLIKTSSTAATIVPVITDDRGRFHFGELEPGTYRVVAAHNGFVRQEWGQRAPGRAGTAVEITAGQQVRDIVFRLVATGTVTGRVTDSTAQPLVGANVVLLRALYDSEGRRSLQPVSTVRTNDRGEYRIFWITPGQYFVNANALRPFDELALTNPAAGIVYNGPPRSDGITRVAEGALYNPNSVVDQAYTSIYYPQTTDEIRAIPITVPSGMELGGIDFVLARQRLARIRGRIVDGAFGQAPRRGSITLRTGGNSLPTSSYDQATGEFEIRDVPPGIYEVTATMLAPNPATTPNTTLNTRIEVSGADIENLIYTLRAGTNVSGRFSVETRSIPGELEGFNRITLRVPLSRGENLGPFVTIGNDGSFNATNLAEGEYRLTVGNLPGNTYVKTIRLGSNEISQPGFRVPISEPGGIEIVLNPNGGQITGTTAPKAQVVLVPTQRDRHELYKEVLSDATGQFTIQGIAPGEYTLFSWEGLEPYSYHDAEILRPYEPKGKRVSVLESSRQTTDIAAIP